MSETNMGKTMLTLRRAVVAAEVGAASDEDRDVLAEAGLRWSGGATQSGQDAALWARVTTTGWSWPWAPSPGGPPRDGRHDLDDEAVAWCHARGVDDPAAIGAVIRADRLARIDEVRS